VAAVERLLGQGVVVRSDDVDGNRVTGVAHAAGGEHRFVADFTDDGEVVDCRLLPPPRGSS
jgi:hypothetical protein